MKVIDFDVRASVRVLSIFVLVLITVAFVSAQTTTFTYQGRLTDAAMPASGVYDLEFKLYDAIGTQIGATQAKEDVSVSNGIFTAELDFGAAAFDGSPRTLEISVRRGAETGAFTTLTPRQQINSTPYAIRALNASGVELATAGNSVVNSINNAATNTTINTDRLAADVVRLKPETPQTSTTNFESLAMLDLTGTIVGENNTTIAGSRFRLGHDGAFGIFKGTANMENPIIKLTPNGGFLVGGTFINGQGQFGITAEGSGTRMMWHPDKAAFRAGYINGTQWDDANIGNYSTAFGENVRASGDNSLATGKNSIAANTNTVALGENNIATGANSVALGYYAHTSTVTGSPRLGSFVYSDRSVIDGTHFHAEVTNAAHWRVANGFRIYTSSNRSTGVTFQNGSATSNWGQSDAVISTSTGAYLSTGGTWTNSSSRDLKTNFAAVNPRDVLQKVLKLPIQTWNYKAENQNIRHIGAMSQDFRDAFKLGDGDRNIATVDADGVAFAAIQGLNEKMDERTTKLQAENEVLRRQVETQKQQFNALEERLKKLEQLAQPPAKRKRENK